MNNVAPIPNHNGKGYVENDSGDEIARIQDEVQKKVESEKKQIFSADSAFSDKKILEALSNNEDGDAGLFIELNRDRFIYDYSAKEWNIFRWHHWEADSAGDALGSVSGVADLYKKVVISLTTKQLNSDNPKDYEKLIDNLKKRIHDLRSLKRKKSVLNLAQTGSDSLVIGGDRWDADPMLFAVANGIIDLRTGELRPGKPDDFIKLTSPVIFKGINEPAPLWEKFQLEICNGDADLVKFKQRFWGYCLTGKISEEKILIQEGKGRNGKTVENECLFRVFGDSARSIDPETLMQSKRQAGAASPDIVELKGIRLAIGSETGKGRRFNGEKVKKLTGNDKLKGRNLFSGYIEFSPSHKLVLCTNFKPNADADDYAFWQRVLLVPYSISFVENPIAANERKADLQLLEKLKAETSGILTWLVQGCLAWQKEGLNPPSCVQKATEDYRAEEDVIGQFIEECCIKGPDKIVRVSILTEKYAKWCTETGNEAVRIKDFKKTIEQRFKKLPPKNTGIYYSGIGLFEN